MKNITIPVVLAFSVFLAGCTLLPGVSNAPITGTEEQKAEKLAGILATGGSAECKVTNLSDASVINYVVAGNKMKITGTNFGEGKMGTIINDAEYTYTWEEGQTSGFKMKNPTEEEIAESAETAKQYEDVDTNKQAMEYDDETKYSLDCNQRSVSDSEFVPPANVNFVDPTQMQNLTPEELMKLYPAEE